MLVPLGFILLLLLGAVSLLSSAVLPSSVFGDTAMFITWPLTGAIVYGLWKVMARHITRILQIKKFAETNNITYLDGEPNNQPGLIFQPGNSKRFYPALELPNTPHLIFGNYRYTIGSGKSRQTYRYGFIRVQLSRKLPHVILDATSNNFMGRFSNLAWFGTKQRIELEGDFNKYFSVHCPENYGRDTLYWLTPELMELLKNHMSNYDIEIVDNYVYAYTRSRFKLHEQTIRSLIGLGSWLHHEFEENTHRYSDERIGSYAANVVAKQGRRLKQRFSWISIAVVILYITIRILAEII